MLKNVWKYEDDSACCGDLIGFNTIEDKNDTTTLLLKPDLSVYKAGRKFGVITRVTLIDGEHFTLQTVNGRVIYGMAIYEKKQQ